ncbi:MAG: hypothetical protein IPG67_14775 [Acidobacteria bacterium]|nr:hypothetical protein [Acidobacteriota bacterium]
MPTAIKANFGALPTASADLKNVGGDVVWSDERQAGYMKLRNLPKNDKNLSTYQLWGVRGKPGRQDPYRRRHI